MNDKTIFEKILNCEIPVNIVYEDEYTLAFDDISPQAPIHVLVIPKKKIINVSFAQTGDIVQMGQVLYAAKKVAEIKNVAKSGYRLVFNNGEDAGQTVFYMHCHVLGGRSLHWPPG
ncbi:MAG: histidine triad nucleotide-binding protein [Silvanigrellaceae bacterium]|nr:histidine triad nucleotide-binding protein [Silvanigrellaceae bacterium]